MADLRIVDVPLIPKVDITGLEKIPTGGSGNYSISLDGVADYAKESLDLANKTDVQTSENGVKALLKQHTDNLSNPHVVTKSQVGLDNVDNTADVDKPMSNTVQVAITTLTNSKADKTEVYLKTETYNKSEVDSALANKPNSNTVQAEITTLTNSKADKTEVYLKTETYNKSEVDSALANKPNSNTVYTKIQTDTLLNSKADKTAVYLKTEVYNKSEVDSALANKPNSNTVYTKIQTDTLLNSKADKTAVYLKTEVYNKSETYNKSEVDSALTNKPNSNTVYTKIQTDTLLNGKVSSVNGKTGTSITLTRNDLGISSDEVMQKWTKEAKFVNDENGLNQQQINDKSIKNVESIADLSTTINPKNGQVVFVKSYYLGKSLGGGLFVARSGLSSDADDVFVFNSSANGFVFERVDKEDANIYSAGLDVQTTLANDANKFNALMSKSRNLDLFGLELKLGYLNLYDDSSISNGTLNFIGSTYISTSPPRSPIMSSKINRASSLDYEVDTNYSILAELSNIIFSRVVFKSELQVALMHKVKNISFNFCKGFWNKQSLFKFVGGWNGTPLVNDTPTSYNLIDPKNGRCEDIYFNYCDFKAEYIRNELAHPVHFVACGNVHVLGGTVDSVLGYRADIYNKDVYFNFVNYNNTSVASLEDAINGLVRADCLGLYIGQNTYNVFVNGGEYKNFLIKGFYIEAASNIFINGVVARCDPTKSIANFMDIQGNYRNAQNTFWGNCANINLENVDVKDCQNGVRLNTPGFKLAVKDLTIKNSSLRISSNLSSISLNGIENVNILDSDFKGNLSIGENVKGGLIKRSSFYNDQNFALFINNTTNGMSIPKIVDTDLSVALGYVVYNNGVNGLIDITGGSITSGNDLNYMQLGTNPSMYNLSLFKTRYGLFKTFNQVVNLVDQGTIVYEFAMAGMERSFTGFSSVLNADTLFTDFGIMLNTECVFDKNKVRIICRNVSGKPVNFTATFRVQATARIYNNQ